MNTQKSRKRCHLCQSEDDHFTSKCPKIVCANCNLTGHAKKDCPNLLQPPKLNINDFNQRVSNLIETLSKLEKLQRILFELSQDSKYEDKLQWIPKEKNKLNYLQSQVDQLKQFSSDFALEANGGELEKLHNHQIALSENSIRQLRNWIHFDTFQSGCFANLNLSLVEPDGYLGCSENVVIPVKVESNHDLKRVGMVSLDGLPKEITLTSDFCNLLPDNTTFINVTVSENGQCIKQSDVIQYLKAIIPIPKSANHFSIESHQNDNLGPSTLQAKNLNQVESNKEKVSKLDQDFQHLNALRLNKLKTLETLKKNNLKLSPNYFKTCFEKIGKVNKLVKPLKSLLLLSHENGYTNDKVIKNLEETFEAFKTYHNAFSKECAKFSGNYWSIECAGGPSSSSSDVVSSSVTSSLISLIHPKKLKKNKNPDRVGPKDGCPVSNESHVDGTVGSGVGTMQSEDNMETKKERFEKLSQEFQKLDTSRVQKIKDFNFLGKVKNQFGLPKGKANGTVAKMNNLGTIALKHFTTLSDCFDDKVMKNLEETIEQFKMYHHELSKDYLTTLGAFKIFHQIEVVGEDKCFPTSQKVIEMPVRIRIFDGVKTVGIITTEAFPEEIKYRGKHVYDLLADNQVILRFKVGIGADKLLYSNVVKCLRAIVPKKKVKKRL